MIPRAPLPLEARSCSRVANAPIVRFTAFRPDTPLSIATATDPNMRAIRIAGDPEVRRPCGALDNAPIRVILHRQLPVGRVPDILGDDRRTVRLSTSPCRS